MNGSRFRYAAFAGILSVGCYSGATSGTGGDGTTGADDDTSASGETESAEGSETGNDDDGYDTAGGEECEGLELDPGVTLSRRLTSWEYENTVGAVLDIDVSDVIDAEWPDELHAAGFSNTANALIVSYGHVEIFMDLARTAADRVNWTQLLSTHADCTEMTDACQRGFVGSLGAALFRAPVTEATIDEYVGPFSAASAEGEGFEEGARLVLRSMLQSARFLYKLEDQTPDGGAVREVTPHEFATRIAYLITGGPPDGMLAAAADSGALMENAETRAQAERLLGTPAARVQSARYVRDWLALDELDEAIRDTAEFPEYSEALIEDMKRETTAMAEHMLWDQGAQVMELLTAQTTVLTDPLATFYGLTPSGSGEDVYDLSGLPERQGILTHAGLLTHVGGAESNMVERGLFLLRNVLCSEVPAPPAGIDATPVEIEEGKTRRFYSDERVSNESCGACHAQFDPMAHAFETYDGLGRHETMDAFGNVLREDSGFEVPGTGEVLEWATTAEFVDAIASSDSAQSCMVQKPLQFALGRPIDHSDVDQCALADIRARFEDGGGTYQALILAIATHPTFQLVRTE